jgi:hypothetical protein
VVHSLPAHTGGRCYATYQASALLQKLSRREEALSLWDTVCQAQPMNYKPFLARAYILRQLKRYDEELKVRFRVLELSQDNSSSWREIGVALSNMERKIDAIQYLDRALTFPDAQNDWKSFYTRGIVYSSLNMYEKALADFDTLLNGHYKNHRLTLLQKGILLSKMSQWKDASHLFTLVIQSQNSNAGVLDTRTTSLALWHRALIGEQLALQSQDKKMLDLVIADLETSFRTFVDPQHKQEVLSKLCALRSYELKAVPAPAPVVLPPAPVPLPPPPQVPLPPLQPPVPVAPPKPMPENRIRARSRSPTKVAAPARSRSPTKQENKWDLMLKWTPADVDKFLVSLGAAYKIYHSSASKNGMNGRILCGFINETNESAYELLQSSGILNALHQRVIINTIRKIASANGIGESRGKK